MIISRHSHNPAYKKSFAVGMLSVLLLLSPVYEGMSHPRGLTHAEVLYILQNQTVNINKRSANIKEVLDDIQKQTGLNFILDDRIQREVTDLTVSLSGATVEQVLGRILSGTPYTYRIDNDVITFSRSAVQTPPARTEVTVSGTVMSEETGGPIAGATVTVPGTTTGVSTDGSGRFSITVPAGSRLYFAFLGMVPVERTANSSESNLVVTLSPDAFDVQEVVVTGIFSKPRESYTGSAKTITAEELQRGSNRSLVAAISNIDPSFNLVANLSVGSDPNVLPNITMRGNSSLTNSVRDIQAETETTANLPLFIMDGFEISLERLMDLDDNQVESITLLKDASATALYGTRGANGVVVVVSKKPEAGRVRVTYKGTMDIEAPDLSSYNMMNSREKLEYELLAGIYSASSSSNEQRLRQIYNDRLLDIERGVDTYWLKYPVRTAVGHSHSVRVEGGGSEFNYAAALKYKNTAGAMKGSDRNTITGDILLTYDTGKLRIRNNLQVASNRSYNSPYGEFSDWIGINPYYTPYDDDGNLKITLENRQYLGNNQGGGAVSEVLTYNPLYNAKLNSRNDSRYTQIINNFALEWHILPEFFIRGSFTIGTKTARTDLYKSSAHTDFLSYTSDEDAGRKGTYTQSNSDSFNYEAGVTLNYSKTFNDVHQLYAGLNYSVAEEKYEYYRYVGEGIADPNSKFMGQASQYAQGGSPYGYDSNSRRVGGIANVNYTYDRRYFLDVSGTMDASSKFGADNRTAPFWAVGAGWNIHQERFFPSQWGINAARPRISYGTSGTQNFNAYQAYRTYRNYDNTYKGWGGAYLLALGNEDLGWQKTKQLNAGIDIDLFQSRVQCVFDYYNKITDDLLSDISLPSSSGFTTYVANLGKVRNRGFELSVNTAIIRDHTRNIYWNVGFALIHNKNRIMKISESLKALNQTLLVNSDDTEDEAKLRSINPSFLFEEGQSVNTIYAVRSMGIDPSNGKEIFVKRDGTLTYDWDAQDKVAVGCTDPTFWGTFSTLFRYKDWTLNAVFGYTWGGQYYNSTLASRVENVDPYANLDRRALYDRWSVVGQESYFKRIEDFTTTNATSRFVMDDRTLSLRSLSLSYDFRQDWVKRAGIGYFTVSAFTEDVFTISSIKQERGYTYPYSRKFSLAVSVSF